MGGDERLSLRRSRHREWVATSPRDVATAVLLIGWWVTAVWVTGARSRNSPKRVGLSFFKPFLSVHVRGNQSGVLTYHSQRSPLLAAAQDLVVSSPYLRCLQTAMVLAEKYNTDILVDHVPRL